MKEKPIIFTAESVNAIRDGRKTQTRRVIKGGFPNVGPGAKLHYDHHDWQGLKCPFGEVGDRLWVREKWQHYGWNEDGIPFIQYAADNAKRLIEDIPEDWEERLQNRWADLSGPENYAIDGRAADRKWRSPIFMPRWASRITLEVTAVCVERLQDISEEDALAEGIEPTIFDEFDIAAIQFEEPEGDAAKVLKILGPGQIPARVNFYQHWDKLNGKRAPWQSNSWVWVVEFQRVGL